MNLDDALQTFIAEGRELLEDMERALLSLRSGADAAEAVNAVFRAAHTIKGSAGLFGLDAVVGFTHVAESVLDAMRAGTVAVDEALLATLLACGDHIGALLDAVAEGGSGDDAALAARGAPLLAALRERLPASMQPAATTAVDSAAAPQAPSGLWHLSLRFGPSVLRNGMDPLSFIRYLGTLGRIVALTTVDCLPEPDAMDPEACYLGFEIELDTVADKATIEQVFEFVLDDCTLRIEPAPRVGAVLVEQGRVAPSVVDAAQHHRQQQAREVRVRESRSVRVDADKLDRLIDLVGELIIASAGAGVAARASADAALQEAHSAVAALVEQVRDQALQLRMVKIGATFARFERVVHDVARELGKDIGLVVSGEDTELDKTVVEKITDPLTHLVRNAMDHGIEASTALRAERGKPARGTVRLNARHDSGSIVIEVADDGGGLDRERILAKAIERGLVEPGRALADREVWALIFEPGFSTARQVTNLSGRGVGMDVVKRNITALRGSVSVDSTAGAGTTVTVRLPLTLAIIDGFQVAVGRCVFVVPLEMVEECIEFAAEPGHDYLDLRGRVLPFLCPRALFGLSGTPPARRSVVVLRHGEQRFGLVVDTLLGESQTVIKPLSRVFRQVKGISGSSIRGSGDVALILDVPALATLALDTHAAITAAA